MFRIIDSLKDHLGAPIELDKEAGGYRCVNRPGVKAFELPGLWFSAAELQALIYLGRGKTRPSHFSIDRILEIAIPKERANEIPAAELDAHYASAYGIFSGVPDKTAILRFTAERARWVLSEQWHPEQQSQFLTDGSYMLMLKIPYRDPRELIIAILRHGPHVKVIEPPTLRDEVKQVLSTPWNRRALSSCIRNRAAAHM